MGKKIKLAILSVSTGSGHVRAAQALEKTIQENYPEVQAVHCDVMDYVPKLFRKIYADSYIHIVNRHPTLWKYMYDKSDLVEEENSAVKQLRIAIEKLNTKKLLDEMIELAPDVVISTHFLPPELISKMIKDGADVPPSWVQVTDFDLHGFWVQEHMTGYFAASEEVAFKMKARGIDEKITHVTGIPIMPAFSQKLSRKECAEELGLDPDMTTLILMSGGFGVGGINEIADKLLKTNLDLQIIALAGKNDELLKSLNKLAGKYKGKLAPMGFTNTIERPMTASDLAITKPGGLTTSECLAMGLPMIALSPIPGQEESNANYLMENDAGLIANDVIEVEFKVRKLLKDPSILKNMAANASRIGKPDAAKKVLKIVLKDFLK